MAEYLSSTRSPSGHTPVIPVLRKWRQEDRKFKVILSSTVKWVQGQPELQNIYILSQKSNNKIKIVAFNFNRVSLPHNKPECLHFSQPLPTVTACHFPLKTALALVTTETSHCNLLQHPSDPSGLVPVTELFPLHTVSLTPWLSLLLKTPHRHMRAPLTL